LIPRQTVDTILNTARIDEVIGDFVVVKKRGVNLMACCPFHGEKTPSFSVSVTKGIYKCFGCGRAGNAVNFVMEHESLSYPEGLRYLAKKYNIEIQEEFVNAEEAKALNTERESVSIALNYAAKYFSRQLTETEEGKNIGLAYFRERGFRDETIEKFQLGYSPEQRHAFIEDALKGGLTKEFIQKAGLVSELENGDLIDRYRGRVIFPIYNFSGKIIAFAGRVLKTSDRTAKYVNSPETLAYHKSEHLYGLNFAKTAVKKNDMVYLVEGYTDVITLVQSGVENVVASSGTSLTTQQVKLITRFTRNITVLYDGDAAGIKAAIRGIDMLLQEGLNVKVILFPDNDDPDSYCRKVGGAAFEEYIKANSQDFINFKAALLLDDVKQDVSQRAASIHSIVESISKIPDPITRSLYAAESSRILQVDEKLILEEIIKWRNDKTREQIRQVDTQLEQAKQIIEQAEELDRGKPKSDFETGLVSILLKYGNLPYNDGQNVMQYLLTDFTEHELTMENEVLAKILYIFLEHKDDEAFNPEELFKNEDPEISKTAIDLTFDIDRYKISERWLEKYEIYIVTPDVNYRNHLDKTYAQFKIHMIGKHYQDIAKEFGEIASLPEEEKAAREIELLKTHMSLKEIEKLLSGITGTTVTR
jgi:DNA primase